MATTKKVLTKKVTVHKEATTEDLILGNEVVDEVKTVKNYEDSSVLYRVTNLVVKNNPITITGDVVETFIGADNKTARECLIRGEKSVTTRDKAGKELYLIEVL